MAEIIAVSSLLGILAFNFFMKGNLMISLYLVSLLSSLTVIGESNLNLILILVSFFFLFLFSFIKIRKRNIGIFFFLTILLYLSTLLSSFQAVTETQALGKWVKTIVVLLPIFFVVNESVTSRADIIIFCRSFVLTSLTFGIANGFFSGLDHGILGTYRFNSFFTDANYFCIICIIFYFYIENTNSHKNRKLKLCLFILIILSQSFTFISLFLFCKLVGDKYKSNKSYFYVFMPLLFAMVYFIFIYFVYHNVSLDVRSDWETNPISFKVNSFLFRLQSQFSVISMFENTKSLIITGYGSGQTATLFGRVMHNTYMQMLFDNGIIYLSIMMLGLGYAIYYCRVSIPMAISIFASNYLFDNIFMFVFSIVCVFSILEHTHSRENHEYARV